MAANTLLGFFKDGLTRQGENTKYFNRDFLAKYITENNEHKKTGIADYTETRKTDFYNKNSCAYCVFLELYSEYRKTMDRIAAMGF